MKKIICFLLVAICLTASANDKEYYATSNDNSELLAANDFKKCRVKAATWLGHENRWSDYKSTITICKKNGSLYMWTLGGIESPLNSSNVRGYDYMVDDPYNNNWKQIRYYFKQSDLEW